jgi:eukaryotic-like serine/threonine-protein kinase
MRDLATRLKEVLIDRYAIKREIGHGGMATVFLARDLRHDRDVALKVLHPAIASGVGSRRFEQEIRLAARLQHPHIVPVHDSGVAPDAPGEPDLLWFTMPFVEGESLRERLRRESQLAVNDAVRITRQVSDALRYAHEHGVIHRDIKPENILLTGDHALVSDFGVALALSSENGLSVDTLTAAGTAIGTIAYMSPEQSSAERNIDTRTDQYSLACVLYEMLVGEPPFTGPTSQIVMTRRFTEVPRLLRATRPAVSESLERGVATALSRMPADRFATMTDFAAAIESPVSSEMPASRQQVRRRRATLLAGGVLVAVLASVITRFLPEPANAADMPPLIAVLPFDLQGDSTDSYFADGMSDEVSGKLANLQGFRVVARASARQYRGSTKPLDQIGEELGVRYILTGKLTWLKAKGDQHVVIRPELVEVTRSGTLLSKWAESFDVDSLTDLFAVQSEIASRIAAALQVAVTPSAAAVLAAPGTSAPTMSSCEVKRFTSVQAAHSTCSRHESITRLPSR